jgi:hypothetical protein
VTIPNITWARDPLSTMAHEDRYGLSKSLDRVRVCMSYNKVRNLPYLYGGSLDYKSSSPNSMEGIRISSKKSHINKVRLGVGFLLSGWPKPV